MKRYLWLVGPLVMLWGAEARASNIEFETHHNSKTDGAYTSSRQDDFIGNWPQGTWPLIQDTSHRYDAPCVFPRRNWAVAGCRGTPHPRRDKLKDFEYKDRDRNGDDDDKYKVKGDYQYSKHDRDSVGIMTGTIRRTMIAIRITLNITINILKITITIPKFPNQHLYCSSAPGWLESGSGRG